MKTAFRGMVGLVMVLAAVAWPCSPGPCSRGGALVTIDGGVPSNLFPLVITDLEAEYLRSGVEDAGVHEEDGGLISTQLRIADRFSQLVETPALIEGERYVLQRTGGCVFFGDAGTHHEPFTVLPPVTVLSGGVRIQVIDAGFRMVRVPASPSCSVATTATGATFALEVDPEAVPLLPFYAWGLALLPVDGGAALPWQTEAIGALRADGSLRELPGPDTASLRISNVFHQCGPAGDQPRRDAPAGRYRAALSARLLATDAGFVELSDAFELTECELDAGVDAGVVDAGVADAGTIDAGTSDSAVAVDGGINAAPPTGGGCGCGETSGAMAVLLAALGLLRRRR